MTMMKDAPEKIRGTYGYYRQPNGWITVSPATNTDELAYRRGGWEPLLQYGRFEMSTPYVISHPLEPLLMRGGVLELSEDQIRKMGLYMNPPKVPTCLTPLGQDHKRHTGACLAKAKPVVFPQIMGMTDLVPFPCLMGCDREFPTMEAQRQHETVMHQAEKSDQRTGESLAAALTTGLQGQASAPAAMPVTSARTATAAPDEVQTLKTMLAKQQEQIETLLAMAAAAPQPKPKQQRKVPNPNMARQRVDMMKAATAAIGAAKSE